MAFQERNWLSDFSPKRISFFLVALVIGSLGLKAFQSDASKTLSTTATIASNDLAKNLRKLAKKENIKQVRFSYQGHPSIQAEVERAVKMKNIQWQAMSQSGSNFDKNLPEILVSTVTTPADVSVQMIVKRPGKKDATFKKKTPRAGFEALLPPFLAILVALFFRRLVLALFAAVWTGATIVTGDPFTALWYAFTKYIWGSIASSFNLYILAFTLGLVGMVQLVTRMGGVAGVLDRFKRLAESKRSTNITTVLLGLGIFFDDYANTVVVGTSMRPITDKHKISREKLAYLVDSTSAPIAGIAIISTWIGYEVGLFGDLAMQLGIGKGGYDIFFSALAFRFYCLFTLAFVIINVLSGRDFGPMLKAERRAANGKLMNDGAKPLTSSSLSKIGPKKDIPLRSRNAFVPILSVIGAVMVGMIWSGWSMGDVKIPSMGSDMSTFFSAWATAIPSLSSWEVWRDAFSGADGAKVLFWSAIFSSCVAAFMAISQKILTPKETLTTYLGAIPAMRLAIIILILAWSIRTLCEDIGTSVYLVSSVQDYLTPAMLPIATFLLASVIALSTGTSWGTMGILIPSMIPVAFYMTKDLPNGEHILLLCFAAVLDGAIFGDHCSPISDTTVMSSISTSCDHLDHVKTQLPYAVTTMTIAALFGYVGVAFGLSIFSAYALSFVAMLGVFFIVGRPLDTAVND